MEGRDAKALVLDVSNFISYASNYRDATSLCLIVTQTYYYDKRTKGQTY